MLNRDYLKTVAQIGSKDKVKHILDCPESNFPMLARSQANHFQDRIKLVCPLMFPSVSSEGLLKQQIEQNQFSSIKKEISDTIGIEIEQSFFNFQHDLYPLRSAEVSKPPQAELVKEFEREQLLKLKMQSTINSLLKLEAS